jgi:hypothetical protein
MPKRLPNRYAWPHADPRPVFHDDACLLFTADANGKNLLSGQKTWLQDRKFELTFF